jgi:hypothetical protein
MKKILIAGAALLSMNAFAQSYLVLNNGITLTTDKAGFVYDFGHFRAPYKVTLNGGQFMVEDKKLSTVDTAGFLYEKTMKVEKAVRGKGLNFFIKDDNHLVTVDSKGFFYEYDKEDKIFKKAVAFGGNFFLVKPDDKKAIVDLYTVNDKGNYFKITVAGLNPFDIISIGGTFFQTRDGKTYTVSKDGFVYPKTEVKVGAVKKAGGNFFIDDKGLLFTVSEEGFLMLPVLPANIKVSDIQKIGANYMIDSEGRIFTVDKVGNMAERTINHDLTSAKILSI